MIQNDKILVISCVCNQSNYSKITERCCSPLATEKFLWQSFYLNFLLQLYDATKAGKKPLFKQTEHWELNSFTKMVAKIDIDTLKI